MRGAGKALGVFGDGAVNEAGLGGRDCTLRGHGVRWGGRRRRGGCCSLHEGRVCGGSGVAAAARGETGG